MCAAKEFHRLLKRVGKLTNGQASIADIDWDDGQVTNFHVMITPNNGFYKSGKFDFEVKLLDDYPSSPPVVWCHTGIYHPNIDPTEESYDNFCTNVCLNVLEHGTWSASFGLEGTILGLLFLMHNPNLQDPLSPYFGSDDIDNFQENVKKYMAGEEFDGLTFKKEFKVIDGILIDDAVTSARQENGNNAAVQTTDISEGLNSKTDIEEADSEKASNHTDVTKKISEAQLKHEEICENSNVETITGAIANLGDKDTFDNVNASDSEECDIELVNVDGECVLLINRYACAEDEIVAACNEQDTGNTSEAVHNEPIHENNSDNDAVLNLNTDESKTEAYANASISLTKSSDSNSSEDVVKEGCIDSLQDKNMKISLFTDERVETNELTKDKISHGHYIKIGRDAWYKFRTTLNKIVYKIRNSKLFTDITT